MPLCSYDIPPPVVLCLGPSGAGKSTLIKRLAELCANPNKVNFQTMPSPVATVGMNFTYIKLASKREIAIRELGGSMNQLWAQQLQSPDIKALLYVVDSSDLSNFGPAQVRLLELLLKAPETLPVLIAFNKTDVEQGVSVEEFQEAFRLADIVRDSAQTVTSLVTSSRTMVGVARIKRWLLDACFVDVASGFDAFC